MKTTKTNSQAATKERMPAQQDRSDLTALRTPTDLSTEQVEKVAAALNPIIADSFALYVKTKNYHWHLSGPHFRSFHLLFDEQAAEILKSIDPLAERLRKIGALTLRSINHISQLQTLQDDDREFVSADEMIRTLLEDNQACVRAIKEAIDVCDDVDDIGTEHILEDVLDQTEKRVWFLFEISRGTGPEISMK